MGKSKRKNKSTKRKTECMSSPTSPPLNEVKRVHVSNSPDAVNSPNSSVPDMEDCSDMSQPQQGVAVVEAVSKSLPDDAPNWAKQMFLEIQEVKCEVKASESRTVKAIEDSYTQLSSIKSDVVELKEKCRMQDDQLQFLHSKVSILERNNSMLSEKLIRLEAYNRRQNLQFTGIPEQANESDDDCKRKAIQVMKDMNIDGCEQFRLARCHRNGQRKADSPRPILIRFDHFEERQRVWRKRWDSVKPVYINEDFPYEIEQRRKRIYPSYKAAKDCGMYKGKVSMVQDTLILNGKRYTVDNLSELPDGLNPKSLCEKWSDTAVGFFHGDSPLSNHFLCDFNYEGKSFNCAEQALMYHKALKFDDDSTANKIMNQQDPRAQKREGYHISNFVANTWNKTQDDLMSRILLAKFSQVDTARHHLQKTGSRTICECNPSDMYWGTGMKLNDKYSLCSQSWKGENRLGKLLENLRSKLV